MSTIPNDDLVVTKRILLKEQNIKKITSKYVDLMSKFKSLTRSEMTTILKEILSEIENLEISILKSQNIQKLKSYDKSYNEEISAKINNEISLTLTEIEECNKKLEQARERKKYIIQCEEKGKEINVYDNINVLTSKISSIENENQEIVKKTNALNDKIKEQSEKIVLLNNIIKGLQEAFDTSNSKGEEEEEEKEEEKEEEEKNEKNWKNNKYTSLQLIYNFLL